MSLVQSSGEQNWEDAAGMAFNMPANFGAGNTAILMVSYWYPSTAAQPTATIGGDAATVDRAHIYNPNTEVVAILRRSALTGSSSAVVISAPAGSYGHAICLEYDDIAANPLDVNPTPATGTTGDPLIASGVLAQADERIFSVVANDGQATPPDGWEAPTGWVLDYNFPNWDSAHSGGAAHVDVSSTNSVNANWNWTIAQDLSWVAILTSYKLESAAPAQSSSLFFGAFT